MSANEVQQILVELATIRAEIRVIADHETRLRALERAPISLMGKAAWALLGGGLSIIGNLALRVLS